MTDDQRRHIEFRKATADDTEAILRFWSAAEATPTKTDTPEHVGIVIGHPGAAFFIAVAGDEIVGSIIGTFDGWRGHVYRLAVHPRYRRHGIARDLVRHVEIAFRTWGAKRILALVERDRSSALEFWKAAGYVADDSSCAPSPHAERRI